MDIIQLVCWLFILFCIGATVYITKLVRSSNDFYVMSNTGTTLLITGTLVASYLSATTFLGIAGIIYVNGPPIFLIVFTSWLGVVFSALYTGRRLRAVGCQTMPDFLEHRFGSKVRIIGTIIMIIGLIGYGIIQLMGAGVVLSLITGFSYEMMIIFFVIVLLIFGVLGGMWAVIVTDTIMCLTFIIATLIIAPAALQEAGGLRAITDVLHGENPLYWSSGGAVLQQPLGWTIGQMVLWILFMTAAPWLATRTLSAKNDFVVMKSAIWSILLSTVMVTVFYLGVFSVRVLNPSIDPPDQVFVWMAQNLVHPVIGGIGIAGIMAAILSTASTIFIYAGFALSRDLYERLINRELSDKEKVRTARWNQVMIGVIMLVIGLLQPLSIYWIGAWAGALFAVSWLPVLVAGFHWKRTSGMGAIACMIGGAVSYILLYQMTVKWKWFTLPYNLDPVILGVAISFVLLWAFSKLSPVSEDLLQRFEAIQTKSLSIETLHQFQGNPQELHREIRSTKNLAWASIVFAVLFFGYFIVEIALKV